MKPKSGEFGFVNALIRGFTASESCSQFGNIFEKGLKMKWGLPVSLLFGLGLSVSIWWLVVGAPDQTEQQLFEKLETATSANSPAARDIAEAFDLDDVCATETCFLDSGRIGHLRYQKGNIRPQGSRVIFVLEDFSGTCIRVERVEKRFDISEPTQTCSPGGCWSRTAQYEWGIIGFGLKARNAQCVDSVVINTHTHVRPWNRG